MHAKHILRILLIAAFLAGVVLLEFTLAPQPRAGQEPDLTAGFETLERPGALFDHEAHQLEDDCGQCHHYSVDNGIPDPNDTPDDGMMCADCHPLEGVPGSTSLIDAFHRQCGDCHMKRRAGPVACGECHAR